MATAHMPAVAHDPVGRPRLRTHMPHLHTHTPRLPTRVLIEEPNVDVCDLIAALLTRLGCEPLVRPPLNGSGLPEVDLIIAEPASAAAQRVFAAHGHSQSRIPIVCVSIYPRVRALLPRPVVAYFVKPFSIGDLQAAIRTALETPVVPPD